jgi:hypothetical protein
MLTAHAKAGNAGSEIASETVSGLHGERAGISATVRRSNAKKRTLFSKERAECEVGRAYG